MGWFRKKRTNDCIIVGTEIKELSPGVSTARPGLIVVESTPVPDSFKELLTNESNSVREELKNPPAKYLPSFLTDKYADSDLGGFLHYLEFQANFTKRYRQEQFLLLRTWKKELNGELSAEKIQAVFENKPHCGHMLLATLKNYGKYRNFHGDPRILTMLATSHYIKRVKYQKKMYGDDLTKGQLEIYEAIAEKKVREGNRIGIYLGLSLLGVNPSEVEKLVYENHGVNKISVDRPASRGGKFETKAPGWLIKAMETIPETEWRMKRGTISREIREYATNPRNINRSRRLVSSGN